MASVAKIYEINFLVEDAKKKTSTITIPVGAVGATFDIAELTTIAAALEVVLDGVINGDIRRSSVSVLLERYTANSAAAGSDVEEGALFSLVAQDTDKRKLLRLPCFEETYIFAGDTRVDDTKQQVIDLYDLLITGGDVGGVTWRVCDSEGRVCEAIYAAVEDFQKSRRKRLTD